MKYSLPLVCLALVGAVSLPVSAAVITTAQTDSDNSAPIAEHLTLNTDKGIAISSRVSAVDPEGDLVTFQIVDSPARGQVTLDEKDSAAFWYTPYEGKKGKDSFTYVAVDSYGNVSDPATVKVTIAVPSCGVVYTDMEGDPAHYAAIRLAEEGIYMGRQVGSQCYFDPEDTFSREEFLALAMAATDTDPLEDVTLTGFYDDGDISAWAKGYVSAALLQGAVQGNQNDQGQVVFAPEEPIDLSQAAVMLDGLLGLTDIPTVAKTEESLPAWAAQSVANLDALDALPVGVTDATPLTRAQAAQMLCAALDVVESREDGWFW